MSTARRLTTIVALFLLVTVVLFIAHRQGQRKHATLTKPEFIARADAVCSATRQRMRSIKVPAINIGNAVSKDRDAWLAGVEKRRRVLKDELELGGLIPPAGFHNEWTGVVSDLGSAELALTGLEHAVKQIDEKDATDILSEIQQIGARASNTMRHYGLKICPQSSSSSSASTSS